MQNKMRERWGERLIGHSISGLMEKLFLNQRDLGFGCSLATSWLHVLCTSLLESKFVISVGGFGGSHEVNLGK